MTRETITTANDNLLTPMIKKEDILNNIVQVFQRQNSIIEDQRKDIDNDLYHQVSSPKARVRLDKMSKMILPRRHLAGEDRIIPSRGQGSCEPLTWITPRSSM